MISSVDKQVHLFYTSSMKLSQYAKQQGISYRKEVAGRIGVDEAMALIRKPGLC